MHAAAYCHTDVVRVLLKAKARIDIKDQVSACCGLRWRQCDAKVADREFRLLTYIHVLNVCVCVCLSVYMYMYAYVCASGHVSE